MNLIGVGLFATLIGWVSFAMTLYRVGRKKKPRKWVVKKNPKKHAVIKAHTLDSKHIHGVVSLGWVVKKPPQSGSQKKPQSHFVVKSRVCVNWVFFYDPPRFGVFFTTHPVISTMKDPAVGGGP